jgi:Transposase DDE domain
VKRKKTNTRYRLRNWREYNSALVQRGSLTLWINDEVVTAWRNTEATGKRGHPRTYTETVILTMATLQEIYHLPLRQTEGLLRSILTLLQVGLPVPDYSTLSRRRATLAVALPRTRSREALHVVVDSTGVKVFGEGEWKVRQHGSPFGVVY